MSLTDRLVRAQQECEPGTLVAHQTIDALMAGAAYRVEMALDAVEGIRG